MTNTPAPEVAEPVAVALDMMLEHWVQGTAPTDAEGKQATAALMNYHANPPQPDALVEENARTVRACIDAIAHGVYAEARDTEWDSGWNDAKLACIKALAALATKGEG